MLLICSYACRFCDLSTSQALFLSGPLPYPNPIAVSKYILNFWKYFTLLSIQIYISRRASKRNKEITALNSLFHLLSVTISPCHVI